MYNQVGRGIVWIRIHCVRAIEALRRREPHVLSCAGSDDAHVVS
ncbi:hypothetical protein CZ674_02180 [Agrococcus casei LMG 22410]|uniref:Uncharacterized protein n=1 Tax=Agrococcus casei LMG 22410 TaxID=1255656 RepID=A0A1R4F1W3_9MICO|nr:hypothetical protein CZ674_02180 [Agrococcus casei LMG 22410]